MRDGEDLRRRLGAVGVELPTEIIELVAKAAGVLLGALDDLLVLDVGDAEPFDPGLRLPADA
jgi:hypothetical protein